MASIAASRPVLLFLAATIVSPGGALAADCRFGTAVYSQKESGYVLRFQPSRELGRFPGTSNFFYVDAPGFARPLPGWVIWNNGESRPNGSVMLDCPEDGMTNEDYADCTQWEGVMYALTAGGAELLPGEDEAPPETILLPDFGRKMRYSFAILTGVEEIPWDVFRFERCGAVEQR